MRNYFIVSLLWLWQLPQHVLALVFLLNLKIWFFQHKVYRLKEYRVVSVGKMSAAVSLGNWIFGPENMRPDMNQSLFRHEMGHTSQSKLLGPFYLIFIGWPSILSIALTPKHHSNRWFERWATYLGYMLDEYYKYRELNKITKVRRLDFLSQFNMSRKIENSSVIEIFSIWKLQDIIILIINITIVIIGLLYIF